MSYEYPVWEFEQKFNTSGGTAPQQLVKQRGNWKFVADPTAPDWFGAGLENVGKIDIYYNGDEVFGVGTGWIYINTIVVGYIELPTENSYFGRYFSIVDYGDPTTAPTLVVSTTTKTYCFRTYINPEFNQGYGVGDWSAIADVTILETSPGQMFTHTTYIDIEGGIIQDNHKIDIPIWYEPGYEATPPNHSNEITVSTLTINPDIKNRCDIVWDGNYAWAFTNQSTYNGVSRLTISTVDTWHYDGSSSFDTLEKLTYHYYFDNNTHSHTCRNQWSGYVPASGIQHNISATRYYDKFYVLVGTSKIYVFDSVGTSCGIINMPEVTTSVDILCQGPVENKEQQSVYSNIIVCKGNLYFASFQQTTSEQNRLWRYDLTAKTWSHTIIPGRHQGEMRHLVYGLDDYIWITNKNNHAVVKANAATGEILASVRINRHPYKLMANQSKEVYIASDAGAHEPIRKYYDPALQGGLKGNSKGGSAVNTDQMWKAVKTLDVTDGQISVIDQSDNSQDAFCAARVDSDDLTKKEHGAFYDDGQGYLWFVAPDALGRLRKSDKEIKLQFSQTDAEAPEEAPDLDMIPDNSTIDYDFANCIASIVTPAHTYEKWDGTQLVTVTVKPYLIWTTNGSTFKSVRLSALVRKSKYTHRATAMVATGDQAYIGG